MSRIHGLEQIIPLTIADGSIKATTITNAKLANAATGATANAIVLRDGNGRISVGSEGTATSTYLKGVAPTVNGGSGVSNVLGSVTFGSDITFEGADALVVTVPTGGSTVTLPTTGTIVNKAYVDGLAQGLDVKVSCRVATTAPIDLASAPATIDVGELLPHTPIAMVANDRVLVKAQANPKYNGIYVWHGAAVAMTRAEDADNTPGNEVSGGMFTFIEQGSFANRGFVLLGDGPTALTTNGTNGDDLVFSGFSGAGQLSAVSGQLVLIGSEFGLATTAVANGSYGSGITIPSFTVDIYGRLTAAGERNIDLVADFGVNASASELNTMDGITASTAELNIMDGVTASTAELNTMDGITATVTELNALHSAGCDNADFIKLHGITVSTMNINDLVTLTELASVTDEASGADMVGVTPTGNLAANTVQHALEELQGDLNLINGATAGMVDYEFVANAADGETVVYTVVGAPTTHAYVAGSLKVYLNGLLMKKDVSGGGSVAAGCYKETTPGSGEFTFGTAPLYTGAHGSLTTDEIIVSYR